MSWYVGKDMSGAEFLQAPAYYSAVSQWFDRLPLDIDELHALLGATESRLMLAVCVDGIGAIAYAKASHWRQPNDALPVLRIALGATAVYFRLPED